MIKLTANEGRSLECYRATGRPNEFYYDTTKILLHPAINNDGLQRIWIKEEMRPKLIFTRTIEQNHLSCGSDQFKLRHCVAHYYRWKCGIKMEINFLTNFKMLGRWKTQRQKDDKGRKLWQKCTIHSQCLVNSTKETEGATTCPEDGKEGPTDHSWCFFRGLSSMSQFYQY